MMQEDNHEKKRPGEQPEEEEFEISIRFEDEDEGQQDAAEPATGKPSASAGRLLEDPQIELSHADETALTEAINSLQKQMQDLAEEFEAKLKYDQHKNKIIDGLHQDLQEYREGLIKKHFQSMITDAIKIVDDIRKLKAHYEDEPPTEETLPTLLRFLEDIASDIEDLFSWQGVVPFTCDTERFDSARQRVVKKIETSDPDMDKKVAGSIRPGYEWDEKVLRPELVAVYVYGNESTQKGNAY